MAKKMNRKNWYKGISATAITLAMAGAAFSIPAFAGDVTDSDTTEKTPTTGTLSNEKVSENVLTETVLSPENVDVNWGTPEPSEENNSMITEGTVVDTESTDAEPIGDVTKEETTTETTQPPVYNPDEAETVVTDTVNPDGSITETTTTTTPGSQTTEVTVDGSITGEIETSPDLSEEDKNDINNEIGDEIKQEISEGKLDWNNMPEKVGDYTVVKNEDGTFTFTKTDSEEGALSDADIDKLFGEGYTRDENGNLVDKDGHVITISGNTVTVTTETTVDVTITDKTETGSETVDTDLTVSGGTDKTDVENIFNSLVENADGSYTYNSKPATVTKVDGNITSIVVGDTTYTFTYTSKGSSSVTDPNEIAKLLGDGYTCQEGTIYKINSDGSKSEITLDEANTVLNKESVTVSVTITEKENETITTAPDDFTYEIGSNSKFDLVSDVYEEIYKQVTGHEYTGTGNPSTTTDKNGNEVAFSYSEDGYTVTLTTTITGEKISSMDANQLAAMLGTGYTVQDGKIYKDGNLVEVTAGNDQSIQLKTQITINKKQEDIVITPDPPEQSGGSDKGNENLYDWNTDHSLNFYIRLDGKSVDDNNPKDQPKSEYTGSVGTGSLGTLKGTGETLPTENTDSWIYQGTVDQPDAEGNVEKTADEVLRSYFDFDSTNDKGSENYAIKGAPSDEEVFQQIFASNQSVYYSYTDKDGKVHQKLLDKNTYEQNKDNFTVYWYVLKYDDTDGFHIDGCIISKEDPTIVQTKYVYTFGQTTETTTGSVTAVVTSETTKQATADRITGEIQYSIPRMPEFTFSNHTVTTTAAVDLDYTYQYETVTELESVVTKTETIAPTVDPEIPVDTPVIEDDDTPLVETPDEEVIVDEEVIEDEDTPLTDAPAEEVIEDEETPLVEAAAEETIEDEVTPLAAAPQTGVTGSAGAAALPFMAAGAAILALFRRRRHND